MIRFECDYNEGAHQRIMDALMRTNMEQTCGYSEDEHCAKARQYIARDCKADVDVHFLVGGTQANMTVIAAILRPYQGAVCAHSGHINCHETGAVEATGHKCLALPAENGKITAAQVREACVAHANDPSFEHIVQPGMVYISQPTESGTLYTKAELQEMHDTCAELGLPLFIDGARLGYGLAADKSITLADMAQLCDVFYIGGTKVGMLFGEAVVFTNKALSKNFRYMIKQRGGMLAKGRLLGVQFETAFEDGLYYSMAENAIERAEEIRSALKQKNIPFLFETTTNQLFPVFTKEQAAKLGENFALCYWQGVGENDCWRIATSWATTKENTQKLVDAILSL